MSLVKIVNGEKKVIANKSIIDHSQLSGKEAYGCHPISAIRGLPEKLNSLKRKDEQLESTISSMQPERVTQLVADMEQVKTNASGITLSEEEGLLTFTNYAGETTSFRSGNLVDNETIELVDDTITLKQVYAGEDFTGLGTVNNPLELSSTYKSAITDHFSGIDSDIEVIESSLNTINTNIADINDKDSIQDADIVVLTDKVNSLQGIGGYLPADTFGANPSQEALFEYALQQLNLSDNAEIPNGTRVKNLTDNNLWILDNIPELDKLEWINDGQDTVEIAGLNKAGIVKSSNEDLEVFVNTTLGTMSVNGLSEILDTYDQSIDGINSNITGIQNNISNIYANLSHKYLHTINMVHTTTQETWNCQFQLLTDSNQVFLQTSDIGHYLFTHNKNNKIFKSPATGMCTLGDKKYYITAIKALSDYSTWFEMYDAETGVFKDDINSSAIDIIDFVE